MHVPLARRSGSRPIRARPLPKWLTAAACWCAGVVIAAPAWVPPGGRGAATAPPSAAAQAPAPVAPSPAAPDRDSDVGPASTAADATGSAPDTEDALRRDGRCDRCGCGNGVRRVCVPTPVEREKTKVCWSHRCEEICIPGPSRYLGKTCEHDACGSWWKEWWAPTCARVIRRHVPVKREVTRKVPGVEWTIEERCGRCRHLGAAAGEPTGARELPDATEEPSKAGGLETIATPAAEDAH